MVSKFRQAAEENKKLPIELLEYLPHRRYLTPSILITILFFLIIFTIWHFFTPFGAQRELSRFQLMQMEHNLERYENLWNNQKISDYEFVLSEWSAWGSAEIDVHVENDIAVSETIITRTGSFEDLDSIDISDCNTVPKLFIQIRSALGEQIDGFCLNYVNVIYEENLGFPIHIYSESLGSTDAQRGYDVNDFRIHE